MKKVLFVASEGVPFIKTGGLAAYVEAAVSAIDVGTFCHLAHHL